MGAEMIYTLNVDDGTSRENFINDLIKSTPDAENQLRGLFEFIEATVSEAENQERRADELEEENDRYESDLVDKDDEISQLQDEIAELKDKLEAAEND